MTKDVVFILRPAFLKFLLHTWVYIYGEVTWQAFEGIRSKLRHGVCLHIDSLQAGASGKSVFRNIHNGLRYGYLLQL